MAHERHAVCLQLNIYVKRISTRCAECVADAGELIFQELGQMACRPGIGSDPYRPHAPYER